jgi:hypothetical protein
MVAAPVLRYMSRMEVRLFGTDREDARASRFLAAGGCAIAATALAGAWATLPSLFTEQQLPSAGVLAMFVFAASWSVALLLPRAAAQAGVPISNYARCEAGSMMLAALIVGAVGAVLVANTSVAVLIAFACLGPRIALRDI